MSERRYNDRDRLIEIGAVLEHLQQVKADTVKMIISLRKERGHKRARLRKVRKRR
jgi:hypothetical protein